MLTVSGGFPPNAEHFNKSELVNEFCDLMDPNKCNKYTYSRVYAPECPYADINGWAAEHAYVWWKHYPDNPIKSGEAIHHKNRMPGDNRICNLMKVTEKQHAMIHSDLRKNRHKKRRDHRLIIFGVGCDGRSARVR
jgi:hypothetical protein